MVFDGYAEEFGDPTPDRLAEAAHDLDAGSIVNAALAVLSSP